MSDTPQAILDVAGLTDPGKKRDVNEDQFFIGALRKMLDIQDTSLEDFTTLQGSRQQDAYLLMVADGVGRSTAGAEASSIAVETVSELIAQTTDRYYGFDADEEHAFIEELERAVQKTHEAVLVKYGRKGKGPTSNVKLLGPATTLTLVMLAWPRAYVIHVGDSRCYYLHGDRLRQITDDQTVGQAMVDYGAMTEEQVKRGSLDNVLSSAIGGELDPAVSLVDLDEGDVLLICSDGLTKHVDDDAIARVLGTEDSAKGACRTLVQAALDGGGSDNISVVVARHTR